MVVVTEESDSLNLKPTHSATFCLLDSFDVEKNKMKTFFKGLILNMKLKGAENFIRNKWHQCLFGISVLNRTSCGLLEFITSPYDCI